LSAPAIDGDEIRMVGIAPIAALALKVRIGGIVAASPAPTPVTGRRLPSSQPPRHRR
jgi:hypothetical protein